MILVIDALNRHRFGSVLDDMYKLRARVFKDRMGWDVNVRNGREFDLFDDLDPAYLVALDDEYQVVGCNRMLQTTGPHMLADVFQDIEPDRVYRRRLSSYSAARVTVFRLS